MSENTHGGKRRNAGRKIELQGERCKPTLLSLDPMTIRMLRVLGDGNVSKGARQAARVAYEKYQREP
jgi:hypothetical protein